MEKRRSARAAAGTVVLSVAAFAVAGCHHTSAVNSSAPTTAIAAGAQAAVNHAFGDTLMHKVRVLTMDPTTETARVLIARQGHLIVLAVVPGREVELIFPGDMKLQKDRITPNAFIFEMQRRDAILGPIDAAAAAAERRANERCRATEEYSHPGQMFTPPECLISAATTKRQSPTGLTRLRPPAERYLVVLSSSSRVPDAELESRLATLTTFAPDVALTIEAIAAGIYAGYPGTFGGTFVNW